MRMYDKCNCDECRRVRDQEREESWGLTILAGMVIAVVLYYAGQAVVGW